MQGTIQGSAVGVRFRADSRRGRRLDEGLDPDLAAAAQGDHPRDHVLELAHVARPVGAGQALDEGRGEADSLGAKLVRVTSISSTSNGLGTYSYAPALMARTASRSDPRAVSRITGRLSSRTTAVDVIAVYKALGGGWEQG